MRTQVCPVWFAETWMIPRVGRTRVLVLPSIQFNFLPVPGVRAGGD
jgi:hypothetical protein